MNNDNMSLYDALKNGTPVGELEDEFYAQLSKAMQRIDEDRRAEEEAKREAETRTAAEKELKAADELESAKQEVAAAINKYFNLLDGKNDEATNEMTTSWILDYLDYIEQMYRKSLK